ncbi:hypothetical protein ACWDOP_23020 [Nocardia sp. NPDC003693]
MKSAILAGLLVVPMLAGCSAGQDKPATQACQAEIKLDRGPEPLGSSEALISAIRTAGQGQQPVSLGEVTRAAGWSDGWDAVIDVSSNATDDRLNRKAETLSGTCWSGLPRGNNSDPAPFGYYVFLKDRQVVQSVVWDTGRKYLEFPAVDRLTSESMLNPKGGGLRTY